MHDISMQRNQLNEMSRAQWKVNLLQCIRVNTYGCTADYSATVHSQGNTQKKKKTRTAESYF